ncbi:MAG: RCC1 domain-containing protein [Propionicimonas sp.]
MLADATLGPARPKCIAAIVGLVLSSLAYGLMAGMTHGCALTEAGPVQCWGWNNLGQLGRKTQTTNLRLGQTAQLPNATFAVSKKKTLKEACGPQAPTSAYACR